MALVDLERLQKQQVHHVQASTPPYQRVCLCVHECACCVGFAGAGREGRVRYGEMRTAAADLRRGGKLHFCIIITHTHLRTHARTHARTGKGENAYGETTSATRTELLAEDTHRNSFSLV